MRKVIRADSSKRNNLFFLGIIFSLDPGWLKMNGRNGLKNGRRSPMS